MTARELKSLFKQTRQAVEPGENTDNWAIRIHRAISWLARAEKLTEGESAGELAEAKLLYLWIAINSLYSRWDEQRNMPMSDSYALRDFLPALMQMGAGGTIPMVMQKLRPVVSRILRNRYLSSVFWRNPTGEQASRFACEDAAYLEQNYRQRGYERILRQTLDRVYVLRGQIVHGASTGGSKLNRGSLNDCCLFMQTITPEVIELTVLRGAGFEWPTLCYPPVG